MVLYQKHLNKHQYYNLVHNLHQPVFVRHLQHHYHLNQLVLVLLLYVNNLVVLNIHHRLQQQKHHQELNHQSHQYLLILYDQHLHHLNQQLVKIFHQYQRQLLNLKKHLNQLNLFLNFIFPLDKQQQHQQLIHYLLNNYVKLKKNYLYQNMINYI
jgi:hypothetical protein